LKLLAEGQRLLENVSADWKDEFCFFGNGHEFQGRDATQCFTVQPCQRFKRTDLVGLQIQNRLVLQR
jgi:hypothetical protein